MSPNPQTLDQWNEVITAQRASGLSMPAWAKSNGYAYSDLRNAHRRLSRAGLLASSSACKTPLAQAKTPAPKQSETDVSWAEMYLAPAGTQTTLTCLRISCTSTSEAAELAQLLMTQ